MTIAILVSSARPPSCQRISIVYVAGDSPAKKVLPTHPHKNTMFPGDSAAHHRNMLSIVRTKDRKEEDRGILYTRVPSLQEIMCAYVANQLLLPDTIAGAKDASKFKKPWGQDDIDCSSHQGHGPNGCYTMEIGGWRGGKKQGQSRYWHVVVCQGSQFISLCDSETHASLCDREDSSGFWVSVIDWDGENPKVLETRTVDYRGFHDSGPILFETRQPKPVWRAYAFLMSNPKDFGLDDDAPLLGDMFHGSRDGKRVLLEEDVEKCT